MYVSPTTCLCSIALAIPIACSALGQPEPGNAPNPEAVKEVLSGARTVANAAWWGFDKEDSTEFIQAAIDSGAKTVLIPYMGHEWVVRPIRLAGNQEVIFEPGVVVLAKQGEFKGKGDSLFTASQAGDITLRGYGATLRMRKKDYQSEAYAKAEWRMVLDFLSCSRIQVLGLSLESSGGDGIYLGVSSSEQPYCEDVIIRDVICDDNHRQGISVISAVNLLIENCVLSNTSGTAPQAGIDFEPNHAAEKLVNCVMRNCVIDNNAGAGVLVYLKNLSRESDPVSIHVEDCHIRSGKDVGIGVGAVKDDGPQGVVEFKNCTIENTVRGGIFVYDKSADNCRVRFVNCNWNNAGVPDQAKRKRKPGSPLLLTLMRPSLTEKHGGIDFIDCHVYDTVDRPVLVGEAVGKERGIHDLKGRITVHSPYPARADYRCDTFNVDLEIAQANE